MCKATIKTCTSFLLEDFSAKAMASIMALNDDCLCTILSFISDGGSFYNFAIACRRFANVAKSMNYLRSEILKVKADFYLKKVLVEKRGCSYEVNQKVQNLLTDSVNWAKRKCLVTEGKLLDVWEKNGPVAAKLFSWITSRTEREETGEPRATCSTEFTEFKLRLPSIKQCMTVSTKYFRDCNGIYDDEMSIKISCGDIKVLTEKLPHTNPCDYSYCDPQDLTKGLLPLQPARDLLSKEIGVNLPDNFFFWFCFFFPLGQNLSEEDKVFFNDATKNNKPSREQLQNVVAGFRKDLSSTVNEFARAHEIVMKTIVSESLKPLVETLDFLIHRAETRMIQKLEEDYSRIMNIFDDDLRKIPSELILSLLLRTNLDWSNFSPGSIADKRVSSSAEFRLTKGRVLKVGGSVEGDGAGLTSWLGVKVNFLLPDYVELKLGAGYDFPHYYKARYLKVDQLHPVTMLVQECINHDFKNRNEIPKISDAFTAVYFLGVLEFSYPAGDFLNIEQQSLLVKRGKVSSAFGVSDDDDDGDNDDAASDDDAANDDGTVNVNDYCVSDDSDNDENDDAGESDGIDGDNGDNTDIHDGGDDSDD